MSESTEPCLLDRLKKLAASPPLKLFSMDGGGVEGGPHEIHLDHFVLINRHDLNEIIRHIDGVPQMPPMSWVDVGKMLKAKGWTVEKQPAAGLPPFVWSHPDFGKEYGVPRGYHCEAPDIPSEIVMSEAHRLGHIGFTTLGAAA